MARGNGKAGGRPPADYAGTRRWFRELCETPKRRCQVEQIIDRDLAEGRLENFWKAVEHGFGRPPQAVDVRVATGQQQEFVAMFASGVPIEVEADDHAALPPAPVPVPAEASE